jgi:hypothetical protein
MCVYAITVLRTRVYAHCDMVTHGSDAMYVTGCLFHVLVTERVA